LTALFSRNIETKYGPLKISFLLGAKCLVPLRHAQEAFQVLALKDKMYE
jgi:hypothetical protein